MRESFYLVWISYSLKIKFVKEKIFTLRNPESSFSIRVRSSRRVRVPLLPSFPAYRWKTMMRDSMAVSSSEGMAAHCSGSALQKADMNLILTQLILTMQLNDKRNIRMKSLPFGCLSEEFEKCQLSLSRLYRLQPCPWAGEALIREVEQFITAQHTNVCELSGLCVFNVD